MGYILPDKELLESHSKELDEDKYYNLSKLIYKKNIKDKLIFPVGIDEEKNKYYMDLKKISGLLISGETGSGKSIFIHSIIVSLLLKNTPDELNFLFIDPRGIELNIYNNIPHLIKPIIMGQTESIINLENILHIIEQRKILFKSLSVKDIYEYNEKNKEKMPQIVVVIDEAIDILEDPSINSLIDTILLYAHQFGVHLIFSTNSHLKSTLEENTIKSFDYKLTFDLASEEQANYIKIDNSNLLTVYGEALIKCRNNKLVNIQTPYISDKDIRKVVDFINKQKD